MMVIYQTYRKRNNNHIQSDNPPSNKFHSSLKGTYQSYHHQKIFFTKQHHTMTKVSPNGYNEKLTYQQQRENNENTGKNYLIQPTLEQIAEEEHW